MEEQTFPDERLELIFTCCHPALALEAQVALTLRTLGGLTTEEIARAFLVPRGDDEAAADAGEAQDQDGRHPLQRSRRPPAPGPAGRGAGGRLPDLQRGLRRPGRPGRGGDPARADARRADAGRAGGARPARPDAAPRRAPRGQVRRRRAGAARGPGPRALERRADRRGPRGRSTRRSPCSGRGPYVLQAAIASAADRRPDRLDRDRRPVRRARPPDRLARGGAQPRRRRRRDRGAGARRSRSSTRSRSTTTSTSTPPAPTCCAGSAARTRPAPRTGARSSSRRAEPERRFLERRLAEL